MVSIFDRAYCFSVVSRKVSAAAPAKPAIKPAFKPAPPAVKKPAAKDDSDSDEESVGFFGLFGTRLASWTLPVQKA